ncbi:MAG: hypothetical protein ACFCGT_10150 [Sandaracinaceae bacterium]
MTDAAESPSLPPRAGVSSSVARTAGARVRLALHRRRRLCVALCLALVALVALRARWPGARAASPEEGIARVAAAEGLRVDPATVLWLEEDGGPLAYREALFVAAAPGELPDLHYAAVRASSGGTPLDVGWIRNLSSTSSAAESAPVRSGRHAAYLTRVGDRIDALVVLDLAGEPAALTEGWPARARWQNRVTNLQESGRFEGFGMRRYHVREGTGDGDLAVRQGRFVLRVGDRRVVVDPERGEPTEGAELVEVAPQRKGRPGTIAWVVDTVRNVSWVGSEPIEWLENRVFNWRDRAQRAYYAVAGPGDTAAEAAEDLAVPDEVDEERIAMLTATDPELGWPPGPLAPPIEDVAPVDGEGRWIPVVDDPFVNATPNAPPAFFQTFLRADPARLFSRVYITLWDPRQVQLRIQAGTREPESATGRRGAGQVPRDPHTLRHLVGAFNGGFQALHGEFGMMAEDRVYLPPKPWAATIAVFDDGRVGMGSWPAPDWNGRFYTETLANRQIPESMVDMRQNLTSVVEDAVWNPWERWWWGAAPRDADEQTYTTRSGLCLTAGGFLAFFWGRAAGPEELGRAMSAARCARGMHLDMNHAHCGFEFFRPIAPGEAAPPLAARPRPGSEFEGSFARTPGDWRLRARLAVRSMGMPFPRYSGRDARDFFYLVLKPVLPGPHLEVDAGGPGEGVFDTSGLPHAGWPHAFARTFLGQETARTWLVRIDTRRAVPGPLRREDHRRRLAHLTGIGPGGVGRVAVVTYRSSVGAQLAVRVPLTGDQVLAAGPPVDAMPDAERALGVDASGFLVYAERRGDPRPLADRLRAAGVVSAIALPPEARLAFRVAGRDASVDGFAAVEVDEGASLPFWAEERPATEVLWPENTPVPYREWGYLQGQRVRYFPEGPPRFVRPQFQDDEDE